MIIDPRAIKLLHDFEGCRLKAYMPTPNDRPTIGYGMTIYPNGHPVLMGDKITQAQADGDFVMLLGTFADDVCKLIGASKTTAPQAGAMICLAYNIGAYGLCRSTVLRLHLVADYKGAARAFGMWSKQKGKTLPGLVRRRAAEAALYLSNEV